MASFRTGSDSTRAIDKRTVRAKTLDVVAEVNECGRCLTMAARDHVELNGRRRDGP